MDTARLAVFPAARALLLLFLALYPPAMAQSPDINLECGAAEESELDGRPGEAALYMPNHGTVHALVVFVQQAEDRFQHCADTHVPTGPGHDISGQYDTYCAGAPPTGRYQSFTEDPATEWPAFRLVNGVETQVLPDWAHRVIDTPETDPSAYQTGSLSHFFWEMSRGTYRFVGRVYPELVTVQSTTSRDSTYGDATREVLHRLRTVPHGLDFDEFDRYNNVTGLFTPDADGDGEPDGDGIFDMLIIMPRTGGGVAGLGMQGETLGGLTIGGLSGVYSSGFTPHRQVALGAHELGHLLLGFGHPCNTDGEDEPLGDQTSIMCGPRFRRMSAPDRIRLGWLSPQAEPPPTTTAMRTLNPSPALGDVIRITAGPPGRGDVLVEARSFNDVWDGMPAIADGDYDDRSMLVREGLLVHQVRRAEANPTPSSTHSRYSSMDNTGLRDREAFTSYLIFDAELAGIAPPHATYGPGDAFTPLSRFRFDFNGGPLDSRLAITDIAVAPGVVTFRIWDYFLSTSAERTIATNYTFANHSDVSAGGEIVLSRDHNRVNRHDIMNQNVGINGTLNLAGPTTLVGDRSPKITLGPGAVLRVAPGARAVLGSSDRASRMQVLGGPDSRVEVAGQLEARRVSFAAHLGIGTPRWGGLRFGPPAGQDVLPPGPSVLTDVSVSGVHYTPGPFALSYPPRAAVEVRDRTVTLTGGTTVSGSVYANGVLATGKANVTINGESRIELSDGFGVLMSAGAQVRVTDRASVTENALGGILASGFGTRAIVDGYAAVDDNEGPGIRADGGAHARVRSPAGIGSTSVSENDGGPTARSGGSVDGGQCEPTGATGRANTFLDNHEFAGGVNKYDASARGGSSVVARYAFWSADRTSLLLDQDGSSTIGVYPLAPDPDTPDPTCGIIESGRTGSAAAVAFLGTRGQTSGAARGETPSETVVALATAAREAAWAGNESGAFEMLTDASAVVVSDADREAVFEATAALLAESQPAATLAALAATATTSSDEAPWARRALAVAHASAGLMGDADVLAESLTAEAAGPDGISAHAAFGHALRVRLAVEADSASMALDRLAALAALATEGDTLATETFSSALALVVATFPDADVSAVIGSAHSAALPDALLGTTKVGDAMDGLAVWPNPMTAAATVRVSVSTPARSAVAVVYDALGRRVGVLHDGPLDTGAHDFTLAAPDLAPGVYVLQVRVSPEGGAATWTEVRRVTVTR